MKFEKKPTSVEAWKFIELIQTDHHEAPPEPLITIVEASNLGIRLRPVGSKGAELWCEKSEAWVRCPYDTWIVREPDGSGFYPYHDGFEDAHVIAVPDDHPMMLYARQELSLLGAEPSIAKNIMDVMRVFIQGSDDEGLSGAGALVVVAIINRLLQLKPLTALTDDPDEWMELEEGHYQSRRNPGAFSEDGGKTYILVSDATEKPGEEPTTYTSVDHTERDKEPEEGETKVVTAEAIPEPG